MLRALTVTDQIVLTHIRTPCDTHGFWVCHHPSPPLHSLGQYPPLGWSSLNSPGFSHRKRQSRVTIISHIYDIYWDLTEYATQHADLQVLFQLLLLSEFLEVATGLRLLSLLGKLSAGDGAEDGGRQRERTGKTNLKTWRLKSRDNAVRECRRLKKKSQQCGGTTCLMEKSKAKVTKKRALSRRRVISVQIKTEEDPVSTSPPSTDAFIWI